MALKVGVSKLYYAVCTSDTVDGVTYGTPARLQKVASVDVKTGANTATFYADNGPAETATALGEITVDISLGDLTLDEQAILLGHSIVGGVLQKHVDDTAPYIALMFEGLKSNGKKRFKKLLKGQFSEPDDSYKTKADKPEFQPMSITGKFVRRDYDGLWDKTADEDSIDYVASIGTNWYTSVEGSADVTAPTVTCVPANSATNVAVTADIVLTFSEAMMASSLVVGSSFILQKSDGTQIAGAGVWTVGNTVYTFNPTASLAAGSSYNIIVTQAVKDLAGNALAAVNVFNFGTAA